jgi:hypothetical protein
MEKKKKDSRNPVLRSFYALRDALSKSYGDVVEEKIVDDYHKDLEKAEKFFGNLADYRMREEEIEYENGRTIGGFVAESVTSTTSITPILFPRKKFYNKILFLKKLNELLLYLEEIQKAEK